MAKDGPTPGHRPRVYCAGPLFNEKEREEMQLIAEGLETAGYTTFLPQRDGLELTKCVAELVRAGFKADEAARLTSEAIFALDVYQVLHSCEALVANLNGRVPDEGTVSEASMAWSRGGTVVGYKADARTTFGGQDNPLVAGLFGFRLCETIEEIPGVVESSLRRSKQPADRKQIRELEISAHERFGNQIWSALQEGPGMEGVIGVLLTHNPSAVAL